MASITVPHSLMLERILTLEIVRVTERALGKGVVGRWTALRPYGRYEHKTAYAALCRRGCGLRRRQVVNTIVEIGTKACRDVGNAGQMDDNVYSVEQWAPVDRHGQVGVH